MEDKHDQPQINFVPCIKIIKRGVSKAKPVKVKLSRAELIELNKKINENTNEVSKNKKHQEENLEADNDEFDMENYDNEEDVALKINDIAVLDENDSYKSDDSTDSEEEDEIIKPNDNLVVVGHVEEYSSSLEVFVYNKKEDSFYVHHHYILPGIPLALEWLNHDPTNPNEPGNMCAVGYVTPIIHVWDLDIVNCIEPAFKLGKKKNSRLGRSRVGHTKGVLELSWNKTFSHILASGSVDKTVILWDLDKTEPNTTISKFQGSVHSLSWHKEEAHFLLTGSADRTCKIFDCRKSDVEKTWIVQGEVEKVIWNNFESFQFLASDDKGFIYCFDSRQEKKLWELKAHSAEVTGLALSSKCPGLLCSTSGDEPLKFWDIIGGQPKLVTEKNINVGKIHCLDAAPDWPFIFVSGGDNKSHNLLLYNALKKSEIKETFRNRIKKKEKSKKNKDQKSKKKKKVRLQKMMLRDIFE